MKLDKEAKKGDFPLINVKSGKFDVFLYESTYEKKKKSTSNQPDTRRRYKAESQH